MTFSNEWDQRYQENTHMSIWPWSDLVSFVKRYSKSIKVSRVLELGCGAGANIPFFKSLKVDYYAIDGSKTAVQRLWNRFRNIAVILAQRILPMKYHLIVA